MRHLRLVFLFVAAWLVAACTDVPTQPPASTVPNFAQLGNVRVPVAFSGVTCDSDLVEGTAIGHFHNTSTHDANGRLHITNHTTIIGSAVAQQTGATYRVSFEDNLSLSLPESPLTFTEVMHLVLIGQGGAPNLVAQTLAHFTVNANGVLTAAIDKFVVHCPT
jgi:hypothetical protein